MWELDCEKGWVLKNSCFWTVVLEKTLESPLDCREIKPVHPKGNHSCIFIRRIDAEAETPIFWQPDVKSQFIGKDPDSGKDWRQEKGTTEDEMIGWHHWLNGHEFEKAPGDGEGQGSLGCCSPWGCRIGQDLASEQQQEQLLCSPRSWLEVSSCPVRSFPSTVPSSFMKGTYIEPQGLPSAERKHTGIERDSWPSLGQTF